MGMVRIRVGKFEWENSIEYIKWTVSSEGYSPLNPSPGGDMGQQVRSVAIAAEEEDTISGGP
jgi:hypothetical protein